MEWAGFVGRDEVCCWISLHGAAAEDVEQEDDRASFLVVRWWTEVDLLALPQDEDVVEEVDRLGAGMVQSQDQGSPVHGDVLQELHYVPGAGSVELRSRIVEEEDAGIRSELDRNCQLLGDLSGSLVHLLEDPDELLAYVREARQLEYDIDVTSFLGGGDVPPESEVRAELERLPDCKIRLMHLNILREAGDAVEASLVQLDAVDEYLASCRHSTG